MENLKELIRKAGHSTVPAAWLMNDAPLDGGKSKLERLTDFAEALLAEIAKEPEPIAWMNPCNGVTIYNGMKTLHPDRYQNFSIPCFPFPPSTEQIENRVAEACAEFVHSNIIYPMNIPKAIRSGIWREYLK